MEFQGRSQSLPIETATPVSHILAMNSALVPIAFPQAEIEALAARYARANGGPMSLLNRFGGTVEKQMANLPESVRQRIADLSVQALEQAYGAAARGGRLGRLGGRRQMALAGLTGAAGGVGGMPTALAELPFTITLILRTIQEVAETHGFSPEDPATRRACLEVFSAGSPLAADDGVNTGFLGARLTLTGPALHKMIAKVAPKLAAALGQKLAAQAVPVLGAVAGAGLNLAFVGYYREMAEIRFGLLRLGAHHDPAEVSAAFAAAAASARPVLRA